MAIGNYGQVERNKWRYQYGSKSLKYAWDELFHKSANAGFDVTKEVLVKLLSSNTTFTNDILKQIVDTYIAAAKKVWKCKDVEERKQLAREINKQENTKKFVEIHNKVEEKIKQFCPNLVDELG